MNQPLKKLIKIAVLQRNSLAFEFGQNDYADRELKNVLKANGAISVDFSKDKEIMTVVLPK